MGECKYYNSPLPFQRMVLTKIELQPGTYHFGQLGRHQVIADFSGGQMTSDGGLVLIAQLDPGSCGFCGVDA